MYFARLASRARNWPYVSHYSFHSFLTLRGWIGNRRSVKQTVSRPKRKRKLDDDFDFIASDDDDDYGDDYDDDVDYDIIPTSATTSPERRKCNNFDPLTNVILLCGPPGSGKSCAVYACAKELDWEVFEVWPGIGKRGAKDLDAYVGDVGSNQVVESGGRERQALILLEEVDLLWNSDKAFWEGVVDLASKSKRPIVMTCNGEWSAFVNRTSRLFTALQILSSCHPTSFLFKPSLISNPRNPNRPFLSFGPFFFWNAMPTCRICWIAFIPLVLWLLGTTHPVGRICGVR
jgi:hypothetical protein